MFKIYIISMLLYIISYNLVKLRLRLNELKQEHHSTLLVLFWALCPFINSVASILITVGLFMPKNIFIKLNS